MARQIQLRRGTTSQNDLFIGAEGELTMDTDTKSLRVHDGSTAGGTLIPSLVDFQKPTLSNNYTWYRLYSDGWVEQGGEDSAGSGVKIINLPITMLSNRYTLIASTVSQSASSGIGVYHYSNTQIQVNKPNSWCEWVVFGYAA